MLADVYTMRRRSRKERSIIAILRGAYATPPPSQFVLSLALSRKGEEAFDHLRHLALKNGFMIRPAGTQFVDRDELALLHWLARAQRRAGLPADVHPDERLRAAITRCSEILASSNLHLSWPLNPTAPLPNALSPMLG